jgi:hypothetical protein
MFEARMFETGTLRELICDHFSFPKWEWERSWGGTPLPPVQWDHQLRGKLRSNLWGSVV